MADNWLRGWLGLGGLTVVLLLAGRAGAVPRMIVDMGAPSGSRERTATSLSLAGQGYTGRVAGSFVGVQTFDAVDPGLLSAEGPERAWIGVRRRELTGLIKASHAAGLACYAGGDVVVFPRALVRRFRGEICDERGRIDLHRPKTQELFRLMLRETFDRFPDLDGLVIRTGEVYLHNFPHHAASGLETESKIQGNTAILRGPETHELLLHILREEVCEKRGRTVIYRTWDFGPKGFHENPDYYRRVTDAIEPHTNLIFSVKHQKGDFHQLTPFNPTLCIGRHRQIVEVQAQREAYGKGAHPYYIGQGVIDGWEEYDRIMKPGEPRGLRDIIAHPLCAGVWIWSRGGGWEGPVVPDGFWCDLNTDVVRAFALDPTRSETDCFAACAAARGLKGEDVARFRELNLLSAQAVLRGQLTLLGATIDVWWARDHFLAAPNLDDFIRRGLVDQALAEKAEAVQLWTRIEALSREIRFPDEATRDFVVTSAVYGRIKYAIVEQGWTILMLGRLGDQSGRYDVARLRRAIDAYDRLWREWQVLKAQQPGCSTLYKDVAFRDKPGLGAAVDRYRNKIAKQS